MPQAHNPLEQLVYDIGQRLGQAMIEGLRTTLSNANLGTISLPKRGPGRPPRTASEAKCLVPGCDRRSVAKKLCPTHYRKANRLKMESPFSTSDLELLAKDGRATRWEKKAAAPKAAAKVAKRGRKASKSAAKKAA